MLLLFSREVPRGIDAWEAVVPPLFSLVLLPVTDMCSQIYVGRQDIGCEGHEGQDGLITTLILAQVMY